MRNITRSLLRASCAKFGVYPTRLTAMPDLIEFVHKLRPIQTGRELVRLGPNGDGGYLLPDDLEGIEACFSPGVADVSGFEKDCADRGMKVFMADASVDKPAEFHESFSFVKKYLGATTDDQFMTLDSWVENACDQRGGDILLQIDIEGFEYEVLLAVSDALMSRMRIIVAEFHNLHFLRSRPFFQIISRCFEKILQTHSCVHIHPNNRCGSETLGGLEIPAAAEFTFLRNDRVTEPRYVSKFPHPLDRDNTARRPLNLPNWWYK